VFPSKEILQVQCSPQRKFYNAQLFVLMLMLLRQLAFLSASRGGARPQKFEKRVLTIFRLEHDPYAIHASAGL